MGRPEFGSHHGNTPTWVGTCTETGKRQYTTRKSAKSYQKRTKRYFKERDQHWSPYKCNSCDYWHIGHTPYHLR